MKKGIVGALLIAAAVLLLWPRKGAHDQEERDTPESPKPVHRPTVVRGSPPVFLPASSQPPEPMGFDLPDIARRYRDEMCRCETIACAAAVDDRIGPLLHGSPRTIEEFGASEPMRDGAKRCRETLYARKLGTATAEPNDVEAARAEMLAERARHLGDAGTPP
jgi:hypothetical protein